MHPRIPSILRPFYRRFAPFLIAATLTPFAWSAPLLRDGDRVLFVGDSYIGQHGCTALVMDAIALHHPSANIAFRTVSISHLAFASQGIPQAYIPPTIDSDILRENPTVVILSFGLERLPTKKLDQTGIFPRFFVGPLTEIVTKCQAAGAKVILVTPGCLDLVKQPELAGTAAQENLAIYRKAVQDLAAKTQAGLIDLWALTNAVLQRERTATPEFSLVREGIILNDTGHALVAGAFLDALGEAPLISGVSIDAAAATFETQHCTVRDLRILDGTVTFARKDDALPASIPQQGSPAVPLHPALHAQEQYLLKISGLREGRWKVAAGDIDVGVFSEKDLAAGVNLAWQPGPWRELGARLHQLAVQQELISGEMRNTIACTSSCPWGPSQNAWSC